ncbi:MAG: hypothetical protein ACI8X5_004187 [Planctomycetota bacterium]|jgi:hypothetical protein
MLLSAGSFRDDCTGCQLNADVEQTDTATCGDCKLTLWLEVGYVTENCGNHGVDCEDAECGYTWTLKYKTEELVSGGCASQSFTMSGRSFSPSSSSVTIKTSAADEFCGISTPYSFTMAADACSGTSAAVAGNHGCASCDDI